MKTLKVACLYNCKWGCGQFHMWFLSRWQLVLSNWLLWLTWPMSVLVIIGLCQHFRIACDQLDHQAAEIHHAVALNTDHLDWILSTFTILPYFLKDFYQHLPAKRQAQLVHNENKLEMTWYSNVVESGLHTPITHVRRHWRCHPLKITQISNPLSSFLKGIVTICFLSHFM